MGSRLPLQRILCLFMGSWVFPAPTLWSQSLGFPLSLLGCFLGGQRAFLFFPLLLLLFIIIVIIVIGIFLRILLCGEKFSDKTGSRGLVPTGCYGAPSTSCSGFQWEALCSVSLSPSLLTCLSVCLCIPMCLPTVRTCCCAASFDPSGVLMVTSCSSRLDPTALVSLYCSGVGVGGERSGEPHPRAGCCRVIPASQGQLAPSVPHPLPPCHSPPPTSGARATRKVSRGSRFLASGSLRNLA